MATNEIKRTGPKYRKVHPLFWSLPEVNDLEADDKVTPLYVLTCEQLSRIGLFRFSIGMAAQDLGRTPEYIRDSLERVCSVMSWSFDERTQTLLIPEWFKWHPPTNQSHAVGCLEDLQQLPPTPLLKAWRDSAVENLYPEYHGFLACALSKAGHAELAQGVGHPVGTLSTPCRHGVETRNQDSVFSIQDSGFRNQEDQESATHSSAIKAPDHSCSSDGQEDDLSTIQTAWNEMATANTLPTIQRMSEPRKKATMARVREMGLDTVLAMIDRVPTCPHLIGQNDRGWTASFDWAIKPANFDKIIEGNYDRKANDARNAEGNGNGMVRKISADGEEQFYR